MYKLISTIYIYIHRPQKIHYIISHQYPTNIKLIRWFSPCLTIPNIVPQYPGASQKNDGRNFRSNVPEDSVAHHWACHLWVKDGPRWSLGDAPWSVLSGVFGWCQWWCWSLRDAATDIRFASPTANLAWSHTYSTLATAFGATQLLDEIQHGFCFTGALKVTPNFPHQLTSTQEEQVQHKLPTAQPDRHTHTVAIAAPRDRRAHATSPQL